MLEGFFAHFCAQFPEALNKTNPQGLFPMVYHCYGGEGGGGQLLPDPAPTFEQAAPAAPAPLAEDGGGSSGKHGGSGEGGGGQRLPDPAPTCEQAAPAAPAPLAEDGGGGARGERLVGRGPVRSR